MASKHIEKTGEEVSEIQAMSLALHRFAGRPHTDGPAVFVNVCCHCRAIAVTAPERAGSSSWEAKIDFERVNRKWRLIETCE